MSDAPSQPVPSGASPAAVVAAHGRSGVWTREDLERDPHASEQKAEKVRSMFASIAKAYDLNNRLHSFGRDRAWRRRAVRLAGVQSGERVLDVACGTGELTHAFRAMTRAERVIGLDYTPEMLEIARRKREEPGVEYMQGDAMMLPFADASFDVVSIAFGVRNVRDPARAIGEFRRVLKPGGRMVILEFSRPRNAVVRAANDFYSGWLMPRTATLISGDRSGAYYYLPRSVESFVGPGQLGAMARGAGFADVSHTPMTFGVVTITRALAQV